MGIAPDNDARQDKSQQCDKGEAFVLKGALAILPSPKLNSALFQPELNSMLFQPTVSLVPPGQYSPGFH